MQPNGFATLLHTDAMIAYFGELEYFNVTHLKRVLYTALLSSLQNDAQLVATTDVRLRLSEWSEPVHLSVFHNAWKYFFVSVYNAFLVAGANFLLVFTSARKRFF